MGKSNRVTLTCRNCGATFERKASVLSRPGEGRYCSMLCKRTHVRQYDDPRPRIPIPDHVSATLQVRRFFAKLRAADLGCWEWIGARTTDGYGLTSRLGNVKRSENAHRYAYGLLRSPIPHGLTLDHLCRNRACCNPDHLEPVTPAENLRRGVSPPAINARKTHCVHGHELAGENLAFDARGRRRCRTCNYDDGARRRARLRMESAR